MKLFVRNLPYNMTEEEFKELFARAGEVTRAKIVTDRDTGRSRGFGFIEYGSEEEGKKAIQELNGFSVQGRAMEVDKAKDPDRPPARPRR
jgi:RNA recognition motif-containing protein